jgi:hypothetical protein
MMGAKRKPAPSKLPAPRLLNFDIALELMRDGCPLVRMHLPVSEGGHAHYIVGKGGGRVSDKTAEALLGRNDVQPSGDGMFGTAQTFRIKR